MGPSRAFRLLPFLLLATWCPRAVHSAEDRGPRAPLTEWFVLDAEGLGGRPETVGVVRIARHARPGITYLERDFVLARGDRSMGLVRVFAVEELAPERAQASWRELTNGGGRTVRAEWLAGGEALEVIELGNGPRLREELGSDEGALLPHYLLEILRRGGMTAGSVPVFDPLARAIERLDIATWHDPDGGTRTVELTRRDGTLAGRYRFEGERLAGFQWQEGGAWARSVTAEEHARVERELAREPGS